MQIPFNTILIINFELVFDLFTWQEITLTHKKLDNHDNC